MSNNKEFKNLKIKVNAEQPLDEIVKELEWLGYEAFRIQSEKPVVIYTRDNGKYFGSGGGVCVGVFNKITLSELKNMKCFDN